MIAKSIVLMLPLLPMLCMPTPHTPPGNDAHALCFERLMLPAGWQIPAHSSVALRHSSTTETGLPNVTFTAYSVSKPFFLPHYYIEGGALMLVSLRFRADELKRFEIEGRPFAFFAAVRGSDVGTAGSVWWVDRDGDGKFEELEWNPKLTEVPAWVKTRASAPIPPI